MLKASSFAEMWELGLDYTDKKHNDSNCVRILRLGPHSRQSDGQAG